MFAHYQFYVYCKYLSIIRQCGIMCCFSHQCQVNDLKEENCRLTERLKVLTEDRESVKQALKSEKEELQMKLSNQKNQLGEEIQVLQVSYIIK